MVGKDAIRPCGGWREEAGRGRRRGCSVLNLERGHHDDGGREEGRGTDEDNKMNGDYKKIFLLLLKQLLIAVGLNHNIEITR